MGATWTKVLLSLRPVVERDLQIVFAEGVVEESDYNAEFCNFLESNFVPRYFRQSKDLQHIVEDAPLWSQTSGGRAWKKALDLVRRLLPTPWYNATPVHVCSKVNGTRCCPNRRSSVDKIDMAVRDLHYRNLPPTPCEGKWFATAPCADRFLIFVGIHNFTRENLKWAFQGDAKRVATMTEGAGPEQYMEEVSWRALAGGRMGKTLEFMDLYRLYRL